jgi:hypothetical protein
MLGLSPNGTCTELVPTFGIPLACTLAFLVNVGFFFQLQTPTTRRYLVYGER